MHKGSRIGTFAAIAGAALVVRLAYTLITYASLGPDGLLGPDSSFYLSYGRGLAARIDGGALNDWAWLGPDTGLMPFYPWFLAVANLLAGGATPLLAVLAQGVIDALGCALIAALAGRLDGALVVPAGILAALNPTSVVMSGLVYTDTLFLFFVVCGLLSAVRWLETPRAAWAVSLGVAFGLAALTRALAAPFALVLFAALAVVAIWRAAPAWRAIGHMVAALVLMVALLSPVLVRNVQKYDSLALTSQTGGYVLYWLVPLSREIRDGTPFEDGARAIQAEYAKIADPAITDNPFKRSAEMTAFGLNRLVELGPATLAKSWAYGAAINLFAPAATMVPALARLERTGFYATAGDGKLEKAWNFLFYNDNSIYVWFLLGGALGLMGLRLVQGAGLVAVWRRDPWQRLVVVMLLAWCAYILALNGPIASPKYRLPIEPALIVFFALGVVGLRRKISSIE